MEQLFRIAVFYDGQYFFNVSNYYMYTHPKSARISIGGLHNFIKKKMAEEVGIEEKLCKIVEAHYFRGRLSAREADEKDKLYNERVFDDILMSENVTPHYLPLHPTADGGRQEKGVDVWLALEAYELAIYKRYEAIVLIACDGDYAPLLRKLNTLGIRVMLLGWDFEFEDAESNKRVTRTSQALMDLATYYLPMHEIIEQGIHDESVQNLFVKSSPKTHAPVSHEPWELEPPADALEPTVIYVKAKEGYGFILNPENNNIHFKSSALMNTDILNLRVGTQVKYTIEKLDDGRVHAGKVWVVDGHPDSE